VALSIASSDTAEAFMEYQKAAEQDVARIVGEVSTTAKKHGVQYDVVIVTQAAAEAIIETAKSKQCD
jgi:hypothetical protein